MLLYAWDALEVADETLGDAEASTAPIDLFARLLVSRAERLIRVGLHRSYKKDREEIPGLRGRINVNDSIKTGNLTSGRLVCEFDELTYANLKNQIIRATLSMLTKVDGLDPEIAAGARKAEGRMAHIAPVVLSNMIFEKVSFDRNTAQYRFPIQICRFLYEQLAPVRSSGKYVFAEFNEERLATLFEEFLRNFYKREQTMYPQVKRERFQWRASSDIDKAIEYLPRMETDISLLSGSERLVIEAKFYEEPLRSRYETSKKTFVSAHLYQVSAYLNNLSAIDGRSSRALIIYPRVKDDFDFQYRLLSHQVRVAAVDLSLPTVALRTRLLALLQVVS